MWDSRGDVASPAVLLRQWGWVILTHIKFSKMRVQGHLKTV